MSLYEWNFAFKGQFLDIDTSYYNYGYRYYSPYLGRWLSRDPLSEATFFANYTRYMTSEEKLHYMDFALRGLYVYCQNNCPNTHDLYGLVLPLILAGAAGITALEAAAVLLGLSVCACILTPGCVAMAVDIAERALCRAACDAQYVADAAACAFRPTAQQRALCYVRAGDEYGYCLSDCN